jgi:hypothetical protein
LRRDFCLAAEPGQRARGAFVTAFLMHAIFGKGSENVARENAPLIKKRTPERLAGERVYRKITNL